MKAILGNLICSVKINDSLNWRPPCCTDVQVHLEDVAITGQLREGTGVDLVDAQRFILTHPARSNLIMSPCSSSVMIVLGFVKIITYQQGRKGGFYGESCNLPPGATFPLFPMTFQPSGLRHISEFLNSILHILFSARSVGRQIEKIRFSWVEFDYAPGLYQLQGIFGYKAIPLHKQHICIICRGNQCENLQRKSMWKFAEEINVKICRGAKGWWTECGRISGEKCTQIWVYSRVCCLDISFLTNQYVRDNHLVKL